VADDPALKEYRTEVYADVIAGAVLERKPEVLLVGATPIGRDLAPRLSFRLNAGCTADCTGLDIDRKPPLCFHGLHSGNVVADHLSNHRPQMPR
jgi:electron transfer flavoprotein alpha subunit